MTELCAGRLVGFEATSLELPMRAGVGHYTAHLLQALAESGGGWRFALLASRPPAFQPPSNVMVPAGRRFPNRSIWMQFFLPSLVSRLRPSLCHFTNSLAPLRLSCRYVVTVYDMSLFLFPRLQPRKSRWVVKSILPSVVRNAAAVITISRSARDDLIAVLGVAPQKVHVVYGAAAQQFQRGCDSQSLKRVSRKYHLESPYLLAVSTLEPRKNLPRLVRAFARIHARGSKGQLVLAGQPGWGYRPLLKEIERSGSGGRIRLLGYVPSKDLPALYSLAQALVFPSLYEGFGLPVIEAMACGTPVLTSDRSAMAELAADAALLVDPTSEEQIEAGLSRLLNEDSLRADLRAAGLLRSSIFSWSRAAGETLAVYQEVLSR